MPVPSGDGGPEGVVLPVVVLGGVAVLEAPKLVLGPSGEFQVLVVLLEEVLAAASAGQHREEGVVVPTGVTAPWPRASDRNRFSFGAVPRCRRGRPPSRPGPAGRSGPWAAAATRRPSGRRPPGPGRPAVRRWPGRPSGSRPIATRCEVCQAASSSRLGCLRIWVALEDVLVRDEMVEQRLPPVVAGVEDLAGQFLDHALDRGDDRPAR